SQISQPVRSSPRLLACEFHNPSIEDLVGRKMAADAALLRRLADAASSFKQVEVLWRAIKKTKSVPEAALLAIRAAALRNEGRPGGSIINVRFSSERESRRTWSTGTGDRGAQTAVLLDIERAVQQADAHLAAILARV